MKALNCFVSYDGITGLKFKSCRRTVLAKKRCEISSSGVSRSMYLNLTRFTKKAKQTLGRYIMEYAGMEYLNKSNLLSAVLKFFIQDKELSVEDAISVQKIVIMKQTV